METYILKQDFNTTETKLFPRFLNITNVSGTMNVELSSTVPVSKGQLAIL
jgi:hypothetical protein